MVNGDTQYGGCEAAWGGCDIDFIIWSDIDASQYATVQNQAKVAGINQNIHGNYPASLHYPI